LCSLTNTAHKLNLELRNSWNSSIYIPSSLLLLHSLFLLYYTHRQHPDLDLTELARNNASRSKTHPITYTSLYFTSGHPSATCNRIIMLTFRMYIHCQLTAIAPKGSSKGKGKARAKMLTSVINRRLSLDRERIKGIILEYLRGLIRIYNVCGVKDESAFMI
jgi:hypothetical protein